MNQESQIIAIAEWCGWRAEEWASGAWQAYSPNGTRVNWGYGSREAALTHPTPDYINDMNALHEAWCKLSDQQKFQFRQELKLINAREGGWAEEILAKFGAEVLLRTINRWIEEPSPHPTA